MESIVLFDGGWGGRETLSFLPILNALSAAKCIVISRWLYANRR